MDTTLTNKRFRFKGVDLVTLDDKNRFVIPPNVLQVIEKRSKLLRILDAKTKEFTESDFKKVFFWTNKARHGNPSLDVFDALYHDELLDVYRAAKAKSIFSAIPVERGIMANIEESMLDPQRRVVIPQWVAEAGHFKPGLYRLAPSENEEYLTFWPHNI